MLHGWAVEDGLWQRWNHKEQWPTFEILIVDRLANDSRWVAMMAHLSKCYTFCDRESVNRTLERKVQSNATENCQCFEAKKYPLICASLIRTAPSTWLVPTPVHHYVLSNISTAMCRAFSDGVWQRDRSFRRKLNPRRHVSLCLVRRRTTRRDGVTDRREWPGKGSDKEQDWWLKSSRSSFPTHGNSKYMTRLIGQCVALFTS